MVLSLQSSYHNFFNGITIPNLPKIAVAKFPLQNYCYKFLTVISLNTQNLRAVQCLKKFLFFFKDACFQFVGTLFLHSLYFRTLRLLTGVPNMRLPGTIGSLGTL